MMKMDSSNGKARRAWRIIAALGCIMGASGILAAAVLSQNVQHNTDQVDDSSQRGRLAICAIIEFGEETLASDDNFKQNPNAEQKDATLRFQRLVYKMKATGIECPPPSPKKP
jgi:hypothetical protein